MIKVYLPPEAIEKSDLWSALQLYMRELPKVIVKVSLPEA